MLNFVEKLIYKKEISENRVIVGELTQEKKSSRFLLCFFKGLLIFIATYCSICGLLDAFEIPYSKAVVFIGFAIFSFYVAFLYYNKLVFYLFYIILFIAFTVELARYYLPANSGFQAALNIIANEYSDYFALNTVREAYETIANRYYTVTIAALFLGAFTAILLNVTISGYMNAFETALVTFPYIEIALFIHKIPSAIYLFGLLFVYTTVVFLQFSKHSRMQVKGKKTHEFIRLKRKNKDSYSYQADTKVFLYSYAVSFIVSLVLVILLHAPLNVPISKVAGNEIHRQTQEYVKMYIESGYMAFFDKYTSKGGLAGGRLGGVSQVRPDFQTDLVVTFVPINYDSVYLKAFTGSLYVASGWYKNTVDFTDLENSREYDFGNTAKMQVENIDADARFNYLPYFSDSGKIEYPGSSKNTYEITYKPVLSSNDYKPYKEDTLISDYDYYDYVYGTCLEVPDNVKETLDDTLTQISVEDKDDINEYRIACARAVYSYFFNNFRYTMSPGSTPSKRDFVEYFLSTQKRGFCAHFASATTLLLREMGVPARYCEGYVIPVNLIYENGVLTEYEYDEWYQGEKAIELENVIEVPVNDSYAHAWVEIYLDGYGFVPFEATIPSFEEEAAAGPGLFNINWFSVLTNNTLNIENLGDGTNNETTGNDGFGINGIFEIFDFNTAGVKVTLLRILAFFVSAVILYFVIRFAVIKIKLSIYKKNNDEYRLVIYEYSRLSAMLKRKKFLKKKNPLPSDVKEAYDLYLAYYNNTHKKQKEIDTEKLFEYYERIMYS